MGGKSSGVASATLKIIDSPLGLMTESRLVFAWLWIPHAFMGALRGPQPLADSTAGPCGKLRARDAAQEGYPTEGLLSQINDPVWIGWSCKRRLSAFRIFTYFLDERLACQDRNPIATCRRCFHQGSCPVYSRNDLVERQFWEIKSCSRRYGSLIC